MKDNEMKVSIIIPVFNSGKYLEKCLKSAIDQTYENKEIIVVYDKSTDNTWNILLKFKDQIKIVSKNSGTFTRALNHGIEEMTGEWFQYLGSDDILFPNATKELISEAEKMKSRKFIFYCNYEVIDSNDDVLRIFNEPNYNEVSFKKVNAILLDHYFGNFSSSLIHKSLFEKFGKFNESVSVLTVDYELWLRFSLIHGCRLRLVPKILLKYRQQKESVTQTKLELCIKENNNMVKIFFDKLNSNTRKEYDLELKKYRKERPLKYKIMINVKNNMFKVLPISIQNKIIKLFLNKKENQK